MAAEEQSWFLELVVDTSRPERERRVMRRGIDALRKPPAIHELFMNHTPTRFPCPTMLPV
jgi:hypothetical protein